MKGKSSDFHVLFHSFFAIMHSILELWEKEEVTAKEAWNGNASKHKY
jgi:hypothetical protein